LLPHQSLGGGLRDLGEPARARTILEQALSITTCQDVATLLRGLIHEYAHRSRKTDALFGIHTINSYSEVFKGAFCGS